MIPTEPVHGTVPGGARCAVHPDRPAEFTCARCGNFACGPCKHAGPGKDAGEGEALFCSACSEHAFGDIPLERRAELGLPMALIKTIQGVLLTPWTFFAQRSREQSIVPPLIFGTLIHLPGTLAYAIVNAFTMDAQLAELRSNPLLQNNPYLQNNPLIEVLFSPFGQLGISFVSLFFYPLFLFLFAGLEWIANFAVGARAPFREVFRAICYLQATALVMVLMAPVSLILGLVAPSLAGFVMFPYFLYFLIWLIIALWKTTRTEVWRPVVAQGLLIFTCYCIPTIVMIIGVIALVGANLPR